MDSTEIVNEYKVTPVFLSNYFFYYGLKKFLIFCFVMSVIGIINFIVLMVNIIIKNLEFMPGVILDLIVTILFIILIVVSPAIIANAEYKKLSKFGNDGITFRHVFGEKNYRIVKGGYVLKENYEDIKSIYYHDEFIVLKTKDKKKFILKNDSFNCSVEEFLRFLEGDEE